MNTRDALYKARQLGLDLVEVSPTSKPPVCRIMDYGKFLYEQKKKIQEIRKNQTEIVTKELKFRPATNEHDYAYRVEHAKEWLKKGYKVRATVTFRGREMAHRDLGLALLEKLREALVDFAVQEVEPKLEGNRLFAIFVSK